jgi:heme/copper-type cytochrome/quinol oxidase subunit 4
MKRLLPAISIPALILIALVSIPTQLNVHLRVSSRSEAALQQYRIPVVVLLIFISLFATLFVLSTKKKKADSVIEPHAKGGTHAD